MNGSINFSQTTAAVHFFGKRIFLELGHVLIVAFSSSIRLTRPASLIVLMFAFILAPISCVDDTDESILVFAAASLTDVLEHIGENFYLQERIDVHFNFGGSTDLARQIIRGAPADILISAGFQPLEPLIAKNLIVEESKITLLTNELVFVALPQTIEETGISSLEDLLNEEISISIGDPSLAPVGMYAQESLVHLGLWENMRPRIIPASDSRVALAYVETKAADVSIVYRTDAKVSKDIQIIGSLPKTSHSIIAYPAVAISSSSKIEQANSFLKFIQAKPSISLFKEAGFSPLDPVP